MWTVPSSEYSHNQGEHIVSVAFRLMFANSGTDENLIKKVLKDMSIEVVGRSELDLGFFFYKFNPDIKMDITFIEEPDCLERNPYNTSETMFLANDFYHNNMLSYTFFNGGDVVMQYKVMLSSVMELARISNKEALFTSNEEDAFFYKNGVFFFEKDFYHAFMDNQRPYKAILEKYSCVEFDGKPL